MEKFEILVLKVADLSRCLENLSALYLSVINIIDKEHEQIRLSNLDEIEKLTAEKNELGSSVSEACDTLFKHFELVRDLSRSSLGLSSEVENIHSLTESLDSIDEKEFEVYDFKVLTHEVKKLKEAYQSFSKRKSEYQPKIEMNRYLIGRLLNHHQETFRFWQGIAAEAEATYGSKGVTRNQVNKSTLRVRT